MEKAKKKKKITKGVRVRVPRLCKVEGCDSVVKPGSMYFCSQICKNRWHMISKGKGDVLAAYEKIIQSGLEYRQEYSTTKLEEYFAHCAAQDHREFIPTPKGGLMVVNHAYPPIMEDYADFIGQLSRTLLNWVANIPEFSRAMERLNQKQKALLLRKGLSGQYDSKLTTLQLTNNHGMRIKVDTETTHKFMGIMKHIHNEADRVAKELKEKTNE